MRDSLTEPNGSPSSFAAVFESLEGRQLFNAAPPYESATDNDIAYGSDGSLHVAWYSTQGGSLQYASRGANGTWGSAVTIDAIPGLPAGTAGVGQYVTLALDSQNRPAVSYFDAYNGDLKFASRATGAWAVQTNVESTSALYPSLMFNGSDAPVISYYMQNTRDLKLARWTGTAWHRQTIDAADDVGRSSSIHLVPGSADRVAIAYEKTTGGDFKYAEVTAAGTWSVSVVDADPEAGGGFTSLDFDANNNPAFSYYDSWDATLRYASRSGTTWSPQVISGRRSHWSNLWFSPADGSAHLVYYDVSGNLINHLTKSPTGNWSGANAEMRRGSGNYVTAAFKSDGTIAYTHGSPYSDAAPELGVGLLAGNLVQQPVLSSTPAVVSASRIDVAWTYAGGAQSGFKIGISADGGRTFSEERVVASSAARSAQITGLNANTRYTFTVRAYNAAGDSTFSNTAAATTLIAPPAAPSGLSASGASASGVNLSWNDVSGETGYTLERAASSAGPWSLVAQLAANATSYADSGLAAATTYHYRIRASNGGGASANATFAPVTTLLAAPANFTAAAQSTSRVTLGWSAVAGATGYVVQRLDGGAYVTVAALPASATAHAAGGLADGTLHAFRVYATGTGGNSAAAAASATTPSRTVGGSTAAPLAELHDSAGPASGGFGARVAAEGNLVLSADPNYAGGVGTAVLVDAGTGAVLRRFANPGDAPDESDGFGMAVALAGGRVAISTPDWEIGETARVYVYDDYEDDVPDLVLEYGTSNAGGFGFGHNIAAFGDDLLVQVPSVDGGTDGAVHRFNLDTGTLVATFTSPHAHSQLGKDMAVDPAGNRVLLTANRTDGGREVVEYDATSAAVLRTIVFSSPSSLSVAYSQDGIFVGDSQAAVVRQYDRDDSTPTAVLLHTYTGAAGSRFGAELAVSGDRLLVTAPMENRLVDGNPGRMTSGAAYVFDVGTHGFVRRLTDPTPDFIDANGALVGGGRPDSFSWHAGVLGTGEFILGNPTDDLVDLLDTGAVHVFVP